MNKVHAVRIHLLVFHSAEQTGYVLVSPSASVFKINHSLITNIIIYIFIFIYLIYLLNSFDFSQICSFQINSGWCLDCDVKTSGLQARFGMVVGQELGPSFFP